MGPQELAIITLAVLVLLVAPMRLPKIARSVAEGIREFRHIGKEG